MCEKILGVLFDSNLSFREHIFQCVSKASRMCNLIYANIKCTDMLVLVNCINVMVDLYLNTILLFFLLMMCI